MLTIILCINNLFFLLTHTNCQCRLLPSECAVVLFLFFVAQQTATQSSYNEHVGVSSVN